MRPEVKLSDFFYKDPPQLSDKCLEEMAMAENAKDRLGAMKLWNEKFAKEIYANRQTSIMNVSNYAFMISLLGGPKDEMAKKALETYYMKPGFIRRGEVRGIERDFICNYDKALAVVEKKSFKAEHTEVYGGVYE